MHRVLARQLRKLGLGEGAPSESQWKEFLERVDRAYLEADQDRYTLERSLDLSSAEMKKRFAELRTAQGQLVEASRKAGMADVATSVLHNIGNVLNSVNISSQVIAEIVKGSACSRLGKTLDLIAAQPQPGRFIDEDVRGKKVLPFLASIDKTLGNERERTLGELESLMKAIEHIKAIVTMQLRLARGDRNRHVFEPVAIEEAIRGSIAMLDANAGVRFVAECDPIVVSTDRHKLLGIVTNLLANARDAVRARGDGTVTIRARRDDEGTIRIEVSDDGIGIASDTLEKIFNHGFTTKPNGHGFGLHASACAAMELGGALTAASEGVGRGATFTLTLPATQSTAKRSAA